MAQFAIMTQTGRNKEAEALANGTPLSIAAIAWGDGDRIPGGNETSLQNEQGRKAVQSRGTVAEALNTAFFDILLDVEEGPFIIRETGLFDTEGDMIAVAHYDPPVNKPKDTVSALLRIHVLFSDLQNLVLRVQGTDAYVSAQRRLSAGYGLIGGGDLSADRSFALDPAVIEALSKPPTVTILSSGANATYVTPEGCKAIYVKGVGGGAGGEAPSNASSGEGRFGHPGGSGAGFEAWLTPAPEQEFTYTIGLGGDGGDTPGTHGGSGGLTKFGDLTAPGGTNTVVGSTAIASGGDINYRGSPGIQYWDAANNGRNFPKTPGGSIFGSSDSLANDGSGDGQDATVPGTGGAGGTRRSIGTNVLLTPGKGGADGIVVVTEYYG
ncbi:hypothetical protein RKLH11_1268 [Rhodobacteraceae bacterium KLH11]|nr:hypothetical protein RKLH11_1268 [Rhodobacteraceae bacterium KLH11]